MFEISTIRKRFTLVIPKKIREQLDLKEDEVVEIKIQGNSIIITPVRENIHQKLDDLIGDVEYNKTKQREAEEYLKSLTR